MVAARCVVLWFNLRDLALSLCLTPRESTGLNEKRTKKCDIRDILLFRLPRTAPGTKCRLQSQAFRRCLDPGIRAKRRTAHDAPPHRFQLGFALRTISRVLYYLKHAELRGGMP